ncbi:uncharacterized protein CEXT_273011 [Caerostris extrusa]|uniref:Uncharacterized protein n=1 Tax=Caerostris extrusa TaxID=172846 RepID=A0AAV4X5N9_CAEEX|nr:uncharacterized protein CEXT_273011 [Caerostris extrusa]
MYGMAQISSEEFVAADAILVMTYSVTDTSSFPESCPLLDHAAFDLANKQPVACLPWDQVSGQGDLYWWAINRTWPGVGPSPQGYGRSVANKYDVKFIETSVTIHHNVDELLVGALTQVRLKARQAAALSCKHHAKFTSRAKNLWNRLMQKCDLRFHSCDNLHRL